LLHPAAASRLAAAAAVLLVWRLWVHLMQQLHDRLRQHQGSRQQQEDSLLLQVAAAAVAVLEHHLHPRRTL
jgi:hypothetical protein